MLWGSLAWYRTGYGTPRRRWLPVFSAGANVKVVQRLLGHATAAMTPDRYAHLLSDDLAGVADALGKAIESVAVSLRYSELDHDESEPISAAS
jgi:hypothetical protein